MGITCSDDNGRKDDEDGDPLDQDGHGQDSPVDRTTDILMMGGTGPSVVAYSTLPHPAIDYNIGLETETSMLDRTGISREGRNQEHASVTNYMNQALQAAAAAGVPDPFAMRVLQQNEAKQENESKGDNNNDYKNEPDNLIDCLSIKSILDTALAEAKERVENDKVLSDPIKTGRVRKMMYARSFSKQTRDHERIRELLRKIQLISKQILDLQERIRNDKPKDLKDMDVEERYQHFLEQPGTSNGDSFTEYETKAEAEAELLLKFSTTCKHCDAKERGVDIEDGYGDADVCQDCCLEQNEIEKKMWMDEHEALVRVEASKDTKRDLGRQNRIQWLRGRIDAPVVPYNAGVFRYKKDTLTKWEKKICECTRSCTQQGILWLDMSIPACHSHARKGEPFGSAWQNFKRSCAQPGCAFCTGWGLYCSHHVPIQTTLCLLKDLELSQECLGLDVEQEHSNENEQMWYTKGFIHTIRHENGDSKVEIVTKQNQFFSLVAQNQTSIPCRSTKRNGGASFINVTHKNSALKIMNCENETQVLIEIVTVSAIESEDSVMTRLDEDRMPWERPTHLISVKGQAWKKLKALTTRATNVNGLLLDVEKLKMAYVSASSYSSGFAHAPIFTATNTQSDMNAADAADLALRVWIELQVVEANDTTNSIGENDIFRVYMMVDKIWNRLHEKSIQSKKCKNKRCTEKHTLLAASNLGATKYCFLHEDGHIVVPDDYEKMYRYQLLILALFGK